MSLRQWLPPPQKMSDAIQLRAPGFANTTMRQSLGMVVLLGLLAGFLPFLFNWGQATAAGSALPLARLAAVGAMLNASLLERGAMNQAPIQFVSGLFGLAQLGELFQTIAGLEQPFPGWFTAFLSALGEWINWPLRWLSLWIVYGALVMVCNKALGAANRLQPFFAATGFAAAPLLLSGLAPIPCLGRVGSVAGVIWAVIVYARANEEVTGLPRSRSLIAVFLPVFFVLLFSLLVTVLSVLSALLLVVRV